MHVHSSLPIAGGERFWISGVDPVCRPSPWPECVRIVWITATDIHQPFLDELTNRAKKAGLDGRIVTRRASMDTLPFDEGSFDIIWAEGSVFIIGLLPALHSWKKFLKPEGYLVFSDCTWFTDSPSEECRDFLNESCPDMPSESGTEEIIRSAGYSVVGSFRLPGCRLVGSVLFSVN